MHPPRKKKLFLATIILLCLIGAYIGGVVWRCVTYYKDYTFWDKDHPYPYLLDENYGYAHKPNVRAFHLLTEKEHIPVVFDENGFRIPDQKETKNPKTSERKILFLGSSVTYGYGVPAEKTFPYLTAEALDAQALNAAGSGWGPPAMVLRAREVIPRLKPEIVVVQYSPELPKRASRPYIYTSRGRIAIPYFYESENGIEIQPPIYHSKNFEFRMARLPGKKPLPFIRHVAIPLIIPDDFRAFCALIKRYLGLLPTPMPSQSRQKIVDFTYNEIQRLCEANNSQMFILVIPRFMSDYPQDRLHKFSWKVVHTQEFLIEAMPLPTEDAWSRNYDIWQKDPPQFVNNHPSAKMHALIAEKLTKTIRQHFKEKNMAGILE